MTKDLLDSVDLFVAPEHDAFSPGDRVTLHFDSMAPIRGTIMLRLPDESLEHVDWSSLSGVRWVISVEVPQDSDAADLNGRGLAGDVLPMVIHERFVRKQ